MTLTLLLEANVTTTLRSCVDGRVEKVDIDDVNVTGNHVSSTGLLQALQHIRTQWRHTIIMY